MKRFLITIIAMFVCITAKAESITANDVRMSIIPMFNQAPKTTGVYNAAIIRLTLPEGWYTYYKNGGDTGLGAEVSFENLPENAKVSDIFYELPTKEISSNIVSYTLHNEVYLAFSILQTKPNETPIKSGTSNFKGNLGFLVCKDICIPLEKDFSISTIHNNNVEKNYVFTSLKNGLNFLDKYSTTEFIIKDKNFYIKLGDSKKIKTALFIPNEDALINDIAEQEVITANGVKYLKVEMDEFLEETPKSISGLISTNLKSYSVNAEVSEIEIFNLQEKIAQFALIALFALLGGIILNLMPCVLPVIGLKAFAMMKHNNKSEKLKGLLAYCSGVFISMMGIVTVLVILKSLGNNLAWGFQLQNVYFIGFMILLLILVAFNLLGIINFGNKISNKANSLNLKYNGDFFTGVLTTFIATPCTAPFMATSLGFALTANSNIITFIIFAFLALGICLPIILIAFIPKAHKFLPKPGPWMDKLKQSLAFPILATAVWLVWVLLGSGIYTNIAIIIFAVSFTVWLLTLKSKFKFIFILLNILFVIFSISKQQHDVKSIPFNKVVITSLNNEGKNVFVDFTAKWCLTCQYNKNAVIETVDVQNTLFEKNVSYMVADWTHKDDLITNELKLLKRSGVPVYAIYKKDGSVEVLNELLTKDYLIESINKLK